MEKVTDDDIILDRRVSEVILPRKCLWGEDAVLNDLESRISVVQGEGYSG